MAYRALLLAAALLALTAGPLRAQTQAADPARVAAAKEMMQVAGVARQLDELMPLLASQLSQGFIALAPDKAQEIQEVFGQLSVRFVERKGELIDEVAGLYAELLSVEELNGIIAFYKSPAGVKFIAVQPRIIRQSAMVGQRWGAQIGREIEEEARKELKKRGIEL
jgi:hypothetical protein